MPTYQYACKESACGHRFEAVQSFSDDPLTSCPECTGQVRKVFSAVGVVFKGSGFYRTDSREAAKSSAGSGGKAKEGGSGSDSAPGSSSADSSGSGSSGSGSAGNGSSGNGSSGTAGASSGSSSGSSAAKSAPSSTAAAS